MCLCIHNALLYLTVYCFPALFFLFCYLIFVVLVLTRKLMSLTCCFSACEVMADLLRMIQVIIFLCDRKITHTGKNDLCSH